MTALPSLLTLAIKYASKLGRIHLAEKLGELLPQFEEQEKERAKYDETEAANELLLSTPINAHNLIRSNQEKTTPSIVPVCLIAVNLNVQKMSEFIKYFHFVAVFTNRNHFQ